MHVRYRIKHTQKDPKKGIFGGEWILEDQRIKDDITSSWLVKKKGKSRKRPVFGKAQFNWHEIFCRMNKSAGALVVIVV